jgi:hypothetical protein
MPVCSPEIDLSTFGSMNQTTPPIEYSTVEPHYSYKDPPEMRTSPLT